MDWFMGKSRRKDRDVTTPTSLQSQQQPVPSTEESKPYLDDDFVQERFLDVDFMSLVSVPHGIDYSEWLATHTKSFFENINLLYGCLAEFCQPLTCPVMSGPSNTQYQWVDERGKKCKCSATQYIDYVLSYSQKAIFDETVFPTKYGNVFPSSFEATVRKINRLFLHIFAHIYHAHSRDLQTLNLHSHLNTIYYHFHLFNRHLSIIEERELQVLDDLFQRLHHHATRKVDVDAMTSSVTSVGAGEGSAPSPTGKSVYTEGMDESVELLRENKENMSSSACEAYHVTVVT